MQDMVDFANDNIEVKMLAYVTMNDEPIATIDMQLPVKIDDTTGKVTFDTDGVIESLGRMERHTFPDELDLRFNKRKDDEDEK